VTAGWDVSLAADYHVHSDFSDDAVSPLTDNVAAARRRGLRVICLADHVRASTTWVPEFVAAVRPLRDQPGITVLAGVEAKILDIKGRLDLPGGLAGLDRLLIADHQYPGPAGPLPPETVRAALRAGHITADEVIAGLITATVRALSHTPAGLRPQLAHLFSLLPKLGLTADQVPAELLGELASQARASGAAVEVNEKWACPPPPVLRVLHAAGVELVASTDSHDCAGVGRYQAVPDLRAQAALIPGTAGVSR
jgi:putative hydrolase